MMGPRLVNSPRPSPLQIHLIGNSHLDPVWLWDWREGLNEGIATVRTILDLMDDDPDVTYIRGEAAIYRHIEENDPATFRRIVRRVRDGRWDVVGGTYVQPDTNLPATETLARHFTEGQRYFQSRFGRRPTAAWQADSFGHSAGLPEILRSAGIDAFAFTRPDPAALPLREPAFWWEGEGGARVLAYRPLVGWYGNEEDELPRRLDALAEAARGSRLRTVACFYGLGNHGGGPSRRQLADIRAWAAAHPGARLIHSGLHRFFAALRREVGEGRGLPVHRGELNFCLRGCYASMPRLKALYRQGENLVSRAEKADAAVAALLGAKPAGLEEAWRGVLFNSFHDILPGSSIERACEEQSAWMGGTVHAARGAEFDALNRLARRVDTCVSRPAPHRPSGVPALVWNPHPFPFRGHVEVEACLDYRPLFGYQGRPGEVPLRVLGPRGAALPFQEIAVEHRSLGDLPWRKRVLVPVSVPACGWSVLELGWVEGARRPRPQSPVWGTETAASASIGNGPYRVRARRGRKGVEIFHQGRPLLGGAGLTATVFDDPWGSWGGMKEEPASFHLAAVREAWRVTGVHLLESGPERAALWARLEGKRSRIDLVFSTRRDRPAVDVQARVFWAERSARLKLEFPVGARAAAAAEFEVPGATVRRGPCGEVPGGRWVAAGSRFAFASDAVYGFDCRDGAVRATVARASRYADDVVVPAGDVPWVPATDVGELKFRFLVTADVAAIGRLSRELEQPPVVHPAVPGKGDLPRNGSAAELRPASLRLLALKRAEDGSGFVVRVQAPAGRPVRARLRWLGRELDLGPLAGGRIGSWKLVPRGAGWRAVPVDLAEEELPRKRR